MPDHSRIVSNVLGLIGGLLGAVLGYFAFFWLVRQGFYGMMIPGALLGLGCGLFARHRSIARGLCCGLAGLALGIYTEWKYAPWEADESFRFFITHINQKAPIKLLMIVLGAAFAFWLGKDGGYGGMIMNRKTPPK